MRIYNEETQKTVFAHNTQNNFISTKYIVFLWKIITVYEHGITTYE